MGYPEERIRSALSDPGNNQFKVAYQLVVDHKRILKDCTCCKSAVAPRKATHAFEM